MEEPFALRVVDTHNKSRSCLKKDLLKFFQIHCWHPSLVGGELAPDPREE
jgi:hypothetical protein